MEKKSKKYVLAVDQGTTTCRTLIFGRSGEIVSLSQKPFKQIFPQAGWVEHDPVDIWNTQLGTIEEAVNKSGISVGEIASIGITNQRETTVIWNKTTGLPIYNAIVWQDKRTSSWCEGLISRGLRDKVVMNTGLVPDSYFSASKIVWLLEHVVTPNKIDVSELCFGTIDSWILWNLTEKSVHATDVSNASRTMIFNINSLEWDPELLHAFGIPREMLPEVRDSDSEFGSACVSIFQGTPVPITGVLGDQQASLFGQECIGKGMAKNTYGTGCFIMSNTGSDLIRSKHGLLSTIGWKDKEGITYALEGSVFNAGSAIDWFVENFKLTDNIGISSDVANSIDSSEGVYIIPAFSGLGSPYWDAEARGAIMGLTRKHGRVHLLRALLESIAFRSADVIFAMQRDAGHKIDLLKVDGGISQNEFVMQFQSDILNTPVKRSYQSEVTALGVVKMASQAFNFFEIDKSSLDDKIFYPSMTDKQRTLLYSGWEKAVSRILSN